jgi:hypothetical protein
VKLTEKEWRAREREFVRVHLPQCADLLRAAVRVFDDPRGLDWGFAWLNFGTALSMLCRWEEDLPEIVHKLALALKGELPQRARDDVMLLEAYAKAKTRKKNIRGKSLSQKIDEELDKLKLLDKRFRGGRPTMKTALRRLRILLPREFGPRSPDEILSEIKQAELRYSKRVGARSTKRAKR